MGCRALMNDHAFVDKMLSFSSASYTRYLLLVDLLHTMHLAESCIQLIKRYGSVQLAQNRKYPNRQAQAMESVNPILLQKALLTQQAPMLIKTCYMYTSMLVLLIPSWNIYRLEVLQYPHRLEVQWLQNLVYFHDERVLFVIDIS